MDAILWSGGEGFPKEGRQIWRIQVEDCEVRVCERVGFEGTPSRRLGTCCTRVPGRTMGVKVSHDDAVSKEDEERVKIRRETGMTGDREVVDVDGGCCLTDIGVVGGVDVGGEGGCSNIPKIFPCFL